MELNLLPLVTYAVSRGSNFFTMHKAIRSLDHPLKIGYFNPYREAQCAGRWKAYGERQDTRLRKRDPFLVTGQTQPSSQEPVKIES